TFSRAQEIIFTSGATESNNIALFGSVFAWRNEDKNKGKTPHIIVTKIEHPSVIEICKHLEEKSLAEVTYLDVLDDGMIDFKKLRESLKENTIIISVIFASNEIGVIQPIREIAQEIRHFKKHVLKNHESLYPMIHTDASQAPLYENINIQNLHTDLMTISSEKIGGPSGVGALFVKHGVNIEKIFMGGSQELNLRPGTENISGIAGFAKALEIAVQEREKESTRIREIQEYCFAELEKNFSGKFIVNGSRENRLPNNVNITFPGFDSELMVIELDAKGIAVSEKSACNTEDEESYVIEALRSSDTGSIRITFGHDTKKSDIGLLIRGLKDIFAKYKK
ncbi:MAG: cysteine desulfurase, partial [Bacteroidetes bacterium]|nr:cysteine desulfurase [Bacteroidota bacterium]